MKIKETKKSTEVGVKKGFVRATFIFKKEHVEKVKAIAYWDRLKIKDVIEQALDEYFKNKEIPVRKN